MDFISGLDRHPAHPHQNDFRKISRSEFMKSLITLLLVAAMPALLFAQEQVPMADTMRSEGKIYVVVAIIMIILLGLVAYLFMMDRKVSKLEKEIKN
jgi:CcmD family protein